MNEVIIPSLLVIGAIGAHRSGMMAATRHFVMSTAAPDQSILPEEKWDMTSIGKWGAGIAGLSAVALTIGSGSTGTSDVVGALLLLTASSFALLYGGDVIKALGYQTSSGADTGAVGKPTQPR